MHTFEPLRRVFFFKKDIPMSSPLSPLKFTAQDFLFDLTFFPDWGTFDDESFDDLESDATQPPEVRSITPEEFLSHEEVDAFFSEMHNAAKLVETTNKTLKSKRGRWARLEEWNLVSHIEQLQASKALDIDWKKVGQCFRRDPRECLRKYTELTTPKKLNLEEPEEKSYQRKRTYTSSDVALCKRLMQKDNMVKKDGTIDVLNLSRKINRAVSSLRYNLYHRSDSVFANDPFFAPFIKRYHQLHPY